MATPNGDFIIWLCCFLTIYPVLFALWYFWDKILLKWANKVAKIRERSAKVHHASVNSHRRKSVDTLESTATSVATFRRARTSTGHSIYYEASIPGRPRTVTVASFLRGDLPLFKAQTYVPERTIRHHPTGSETSQSRWSSHLESILPGSFEMENFPPTSGLSIPSRSLVPRYQAPNDYSYKGDYERLFHVQVQQQKSVQAWNGFLSSYFDFLHQRWDLPRPMQAAAFTRVSQRIRSTFKRLQRVLMTSASSSQGVTIVEGNVRVNYDLLKYLQSTHFKFDIVLSGEAGSGKSHTLKMVARQLIEQRMKSLKRLQQVSQAPENWNDFRVPIYVNFEQFEHFDYDQSNGSKGSIDSIKNFKKYTGAKLNAFIHYSIGLNRDAREASTISGFLDEQFFDMLRNNGRFLLLLDSVEIYLQFLEAHLAPLVKRKKQQLLTVSNSPNKPPSSTVDPDDEAPYTVLKMQLSNFSHCPCVMSCRQADFSEFGTKPVIAAELSLLTMEECVERAQQFTEAHGITDVCPLDVLEEVFLRDLSTYNLCVYPFFLELFFAHVLRKSRAAQEASNIVNRREIELEPMEAIINEQVDEFLEIPLETKVDLQSNGKQITAEMLRTHAKLIAYLISRKAGAEEVTYDEVETELLRYRSADPDLVHDHVEVLTMNLQRRHILRWSTSQQPSGLGPAASSSTSNPSQQVVRLIIMSPLWIDHFGQQAWQERVRLAIAQSVDDDRSLIDQIFNDLTTTLLPSNRKRIIAAVLTEIFYEHEDLPPQSAADELRHRLLKFFHDQTEAFQSLSKQQLGSSAGFHESFKDIKYWLPALQQLVQDDPSVLGRLEELPKLLGTAFQGLLGIPTEPNINDERTVFECRLEDFPGTVLVFKWFGCVDEASLDKIISLGLKSPSPIIQGSAFQQACKRKFKQADPSTLLQQMQDYIFVLGYKSSFRQVHVSVMKKLEEPYRSQLLYTANLARIRYYIFAALLIVLIILGLEELFLYRPWTQFSLESNSTNIHEIAGFPYSQDAFFKLPHTPPFPPLYKNVMATFADSIMLLIAFFDSMNLFIPDYFGMTRRSLLAIRPGVMILASKKNKFYNFCIRLFPGYWSFFWVTPFIGGATTLVALLSTFYGSDCASAFVSCETASPISLQNATNGIIERPCVCNSVEQYCSLNAAYPSGLLFPCGYSFLIIAFVTMWPPISYAARAYGSWLKLGLTIVLAPLFSLSMLFFAPLYIVYQIILWWRAPTAKEPVKRNVRFWNRKRIVKNSDLSDKLMQSQPSPMTDPEQRAAGESNQPDQPSQLSDTILAVHLDWNSRFQFVWNLLFSASYTPLMIIGVLFYSNKGEFVSVYHFILGICLALLVILLLIGYIATKRLLVESWKILRDIPDKDAQWVWIFGLTKDRQQQRRHVEPLRRVFVRVKFLAYKASLSGCISSLLIFAASVITQIVEWLELQSDKDIVLQYSQNLLLCALVNFSGCLIVLVSIRIADQLFVRAMRRRQFKDFSIKQFCHGLQWCIHLETKSDYIRAVTRILKKKKMSTWNVTDCKRLLHAILDEERELFDACSELHLASSKSA